MTVRIPFNRAFQVGTEHVHLQSAMDSAHLSGDGWFTRECEDELAKQTQSSRALLTPSCSAALEAAALLLDIQPDDEIIMPSFTFVSTANAFVLRRAIPVFVDIREDTMNLDEEQVAAAIGPRTRAIVPVHYGGVACEMDVLSEIAVDHGLDIVEDAAQGLMASYRSRPLGSIGRLGTVSFHETKTITCGEGGALLINDANLVERAEIIREKGTNRSQFFRGQVDKYTWTEVGSSFLLGELNAAFLYAQLGAAESVTAMRMRIWNEYHGAFEAVEKEGLARRPIVPDGCRHNAQTYYLLLRDLDARSSFIASLRSKGIDAVFHYVPLHSSPAGQRYGRSASTLPRTDDLSGRLVRLPLWPAMEGWMVEEVIDASVAALRSSP
jgi:dTDP-4-amino-4,6-dideoxygalactose transaminase